LLLATAWPDNSADRIVVEADVAGGVLGVRYGLGVDPGVVSLMASLRRDGEAIDIEAHGRRVAQGVGVVPGPESAEQSAGVWEHTAETVADRLATDPRLWFVDVGRAGATGPLAAMVARSALAVMVCRGRPEDLVALPARVEALHALRARTAVLVVGKVAHRPEELAEFVGCRPVWCVDDTADLPGLTAAVIGGRRGRRTWLWRQATEVASEVAALVLEPMSDATRRPRLFSVRGTS
jgi:hypothetical protein